MHIILIGFKSSGKSTVGKTLAELTGKPFLDTDTEVEKLFFQEKGTALNCREIFSQYGENYMRNLEEKALTHLSSNESSIVSTGGGIILNATNRSLLRKAGNTVFLDVPLEALEERLKEHASSPLFQKKSIATLHSERYPLYKESASIHYQIPPFCTPLDVAKEIIRRTNEENHGK